MLNKVNPWILLFAVSATIASFAQMLLKQSATEEHASVLKEYLNWKVIVGYGLMFAGMLLGVIGYGKGVEVKQGPVMETIGNVWVVLLSRAFFGEPITKKKVWGNVLIILGIIVFNLA